MKVFFKFWLITLLYLLAIAVICLFSSNSDVILLCSIVTFLFSIIQFLGAYFIGLNFHINSINSKQTTSKTVILSFDDGPDLKNTPKVLDVLQKHHVNALFFLIGKNINGNETLVKRIIENGNIIGNHSFSHHFWFSIWSTKKVTSDIAECEELLAQFKLQTKLFRPPYGVTNPNIAKALKKLNLTSVGWNIRSYDTSLKDIEKINTRILSQLKPGALILLHDRLDFMPELLEKLIPEIKKRGYDFSVKI